MAVTKKYVNGAFYFTYPSSGVFLKERNYFVFEGVQDDTYIKTVKIGDKTLNFGRYALDIGAKFYLDVSAYYAKYFGKFNVVITYENYREEVVTNTTAISATTFDCYSPFKEFAIPEPCVATQYARITPPNRMLWDGTKKSTSLLAAVRDSDRFSGYEYEMESVPYATYRPSNEWLTTEKKNAHLGETYRNTLPATGNLSELDSNGNPLWIEQGYLGLGSSYLGKTFEEQRVAASNFCRTKTLFENYNGLKIGATPAGIKKIVIFYDANKQLLDNLAGTSDEVTLTNQSAYPYISIIFKKTDGTDITQSDLVGITSSALTNPEAGRSYRWVIENNEYKWVELTVEQLINERFFWSINGQNDASEVLNKQFEFGKSIDANIVFEKVLSPTGTPPSKFEVLQSVKRSVSLADVSMPYVYIRWRTHWGVKVEHLFYLGTYSSDKADAKELESVNYYEELSNHMRVGSFYLDCITQPYDLFYYKTLENSELVEMYFPAYAFKPTTYMPDGDDYVAIKIKSSDVAEAVVDGVTQSTITFDFELL